MLKNLRTSIANSDRMNQIVAGLFAKWSGFVRATSHVEEDGWDAVAAALEAHGAIIIVCWHQRLMMTPYMFDLEKAPCRSLTSNARAGRLVGWVHRHFGYETMPMPKGVLGAAEMRTVLKGLKQGISIGISPDGPRGPARKAKLTPIQWARVSQVPVVNFTFSAKRFVTWPTWDSLMFPLPFTRLALTWRIWDAEVPERMSDAEAQAMAQALEGFMDDCALEADLKVGHSGAQL
ncbi:lysophospholipid acyltransferase family protein [Rhodophyticola sp. SM2404]